MEPTCTVRRKAIGVRAGRTIPEGAGNMGRRRLAVVHEFNSNWIAGLKDYPSARHWETYGEKLALVFDEYFRTVRP